MKKRILKYGLLSFFLMMSYGMDARNHRLLGALNDVDSSKLKTQRNTLFTNTFLFPSPQSALCYGRVLGEKSTLYIGATYLYDMYILNDRRHRINTKQIINLLSKLYMSQEIPTHGGYNNDYLSNLGIVIGYQYLMSEPHRRVKFYVEGNANFFGYKSYGFRAHRIACNVMSFNLGVVMKVRFLKRFYYYQNVGTGIHTIFTKDLTTQYSESETEPHIQIINAGLGCDF